jgi:hypothetical protein
MSALPPEADIRGRLRHLGFAPVGGRAAKYARYHEHGNDAD